MLTSVYKTKGVYIDVLLYKTAGPSVKRQKTSEQYALRRIEMLCFMPVPEPVESYLDA